MPLDVDFDSGNESFSCYHPMVVEYRYFAVLWGCIVTVTGTVGNLMTILAFALDPHLRTRFNVLIVNLALADLLYCTILQPISVDSYLHLRWRGGQLWCQAFGLLLFLSNSVSIITLCLIAASRYLLVEKRATFERLFSNRGLSLLLTSAWALGLASFAPLWPVYVFVPQVCTCSFHRTRGRPYTTVLLFLYFFAGLCCVGVFYLLIYKRVQVAARALVRYRPSRRSSRKKAAPPSAQGTTEDDSSGGVRSGAANTCTSEVSSNGEPLQNNAGVTWEKGPGEPQPSHSVPGTHTAGASEEDHLPSALKVVPIPSPTATPPPATTPPATTPPATTPPAMTPPAMTAAAAAVAAVAAPPPHAPQGPGDDREFKRVTRMCFAVFMCFVFAFVPFLLLNIADKGNRAPQILHMFCANLTWLNSCINPVLYAVMNRQFRRAYGLLLTRAVAPLASLRRR
ncbi:G-protein coupled receptor 84 [Merluccius polli]|uniref:G-protein coupled receptor 84 n=1 Tax=Merluccius polli TaxID=89951 RepID=A0AA47MYM1_MERPO|nr:G-protein coupled receptor 84 [Merluccius polli]